MEDKEEMAIRGQTLFDEAKPNYQILDQELDKCTSPNKNGDDLQT